MTYTPDKLHRWTKPENYAGASWPEYYSSGFGRSRDSSALERSNFECALNKLGGETATVRVIRESHWAVGWVEWIAIHQSDEPSLRTADELVKGYEQYPVVNEDHWSMLEFTEAQEYWASESVKGRLELIKRADSGISIFAARRDDLPSDDSGALLELLRD